MQVSLSEMGGLSRRLEVAVPAAEVTREVQQRLKRLSRTARLKGFRPGKAPLAVITKQFGDQVRAEVVSDLMRASFAQAVTQQNLRPAGGPRIEPIALGPETDLKYAAHFEVLPEISVRPPEELAVERQSAAVTDADVDAMVENMREQRPVFTVVDRPARDTDRVLLDYQARIGGRPLAGQSADLHLSIKAVEERSLPQVDEEFYRSFGVEQGGLAEMRAEVRNSMEQELAAVVRNRLRGQILDALYRENPVDVPHALIDQQVQQLQIDTARRLRLTDLNRLPAREAFIEPARRRVALDLLIAHIVQTQGMQVDRERVQARIAALVEGYPNPEEARRAYLQNRDAMRQLESVALEDQVVDWLLERARITDRPATFKELTGFGRPAGELEQEPGAFDPGIEQLGPVDGQQQSEAGGT